MMIHHRQPEVGLCHLPKYYGALESRVQSQAQVSPPKALPGMVWHFLAASASIRFAEPMPVRAQAQGSFGGFMELTSVFFGEGSRTFGRGQVITISGSIPFIRFCPTMLYPGVKGRGEGLFDFFPVADFYVIKDDGQPLQPLQKLVDVTGTPTALRAAPKASFVEEVVAITKPAGNVGPGRYKIVMNQCLTGVFDPVTDIVLGDPPNLGFEVVASGALPAINYHLLKDRAKRLCRRIVGHEIKRFRGECNDPGVLQTLWQARC